MKSFKWLFVGAGGICNRVMNNFDQLPNTELAAVYSRTFSKAKEFADKHGAKAYKTFEEAIIADVDAVYIATPHPSHMEYAIKAMKAGKPVLCEKPAAPCFEQVKQMIDTAKQMDVYFMEGMWTRFNPVTIKINEWLDANKIGEVKHININFGFAANEDPASRLFSPELAGGSLLDVGVYALAYSQMIAKQKPSIVQSLVTKASTGVDANCSIILKYPNKTTASIFCAIDTTTEHSATVYGTNGKIEVDTFWKPHKAILNIYGSEPEEYYVDFADEGYHFEFEYVQNEILSGKKECSLYSIDETLMISELLDTIRAQNDIVYPFE